MRLRRGDAVTEEDEEAGAGVGSVRRRRGTEREDKREEGTG